MRTAIKYLLLFFFMTNVNSKDITSLYINHLPSEIVNHVKILEAEDQKMKRFAELDPALLGLYIKHLHLKFTDKIIDNELSLRNLFNSNINYIKEKKSRWAEKNIRKIESEIKSSMIKEKLISFFKDAHLIDYKINLSNENHNISSNLIDQNRIDFFEYIYHTQNPELEYDSTKNYNKLIEQKLDEIRGFFNEKYPELELASPNERKTLANYAVQYSFLFKDSYKPNQKTTDFSLLDFINKAITPDYRFSNTILLGIYYDLTPYQVEDIVILKDPFGQKMSYSFDIEQIFYMRIGYRFKIKESLGIFSYINTKTAMSVYESFKKQNKVSLGYIIRFDGSLSVNGEYMLSNLRSVNLYAFSIQASTPLFFLSRKFYLGAGVNYTYQYSSLKYDFHFDGRVYVYSSNEIPDFYKDRTEQADKIKHLIQPLIILNYDISQSINIQLEYYLLSNAQIGLNYDFGF